MRALLAAPNREGPAAAGGKGKGLAGAPLPLTGKARLLLLRGREGSCRGTAPRPEEPGRRAAASAEETWRRRWLRPEMTGRASGVAAGNGGGSSLVSPMGYPIPGGVMPARSSFFTRTMNTAITKAISAIPAETSKPREKPTASEWLVIAVWARAS
jgi:hypothetical protein